MKNKYRSLLLCCTHIPPQVTLATVTITLVTLRNTKQKHMITALHCPRAQRPKAGLLHQLRAL
eukprot:1160044-Pelagomonas_calceolata.AAC.6